MKSLSPADQRRRIKLRAAWQMGLGTLLVLVFSDPMVAVLSELGSRISVPPFYVSFVLAPLASNASELLASFNYAQKKTIKTVTISFSTLQGAACMNNTFVLGIFLLLVFARKLAWEFSAETVRGSCVVVVAAGCCCCCCCCWCSQRVTVCGACCVPSRVQISIVVVQVVMFFFSRKSTHTLLDGAFVLALYPLSLVVVVVLEKVANLN